MRFQRPVDRVDGVGVPQPRRLLVFAKRDVSVVLKRHKVARVGGLVVNRDLGTGVMGNKGGLVSTFVVEKEGFATTCTAINAHLWVAGVPWSRTRRRHRSRPGREDRNETQREATSRWRGGGRTRSSVASMALRDRLRWRESQGEEIRASREKLRVDGVGQTRVQNDTQARSHGQGEGAARADRRRAISHRRRAPPGRDETRRGVARRATSTGGNLPAAPEPPDVAVVGGREAPFTSALSPRARRDARPEARRRFGGVLLQAAPRRAVPRVHPRHGRRVAGVQKGGARGAAAAEADVLPRPGLSRSSCGY